jgi:hypothetical protein
MISSDRFGGRGTTAGSRVQIGSTGETEPGTGISAEQQAGGSRKRQLLSYHIPHIDVRGPFQQGVEVGIVGRFRIGAEHGCIDVDVDLGPYISQAPPAFALHGSVDVPAPEILPFARGLQLPCHGDRAYQIQVQPFKGGVVGPKLPHRSNRAPLKLPEVHSQHSRLN